MALPLSAGGLGICIGANVVPVAYLASVLQSLPLQKEIPSGWDQVVPVVAAVLDAKAAFCRLIPNDPVVVLDDPLFIP